MRKHALSVHSGGSERDSLRVSSVDLKQKEELVSDYVAKIFDQ